MFGKKKAAQPDKKTPHVRMTVIPDVFYGGKDPVVYHEPKKVAPPPTKKTPPKPPPRRPARPSAPVKPFPVKKLLAIGIPLLIVIVGGISWYYLRPATPTPVVQAPPPPPLPPPPAPEPPPLPPEPPPEPEAPTSTPQIEQRAITFPQILLRDSNDLDADTLTDLEEELFGTDSGIWDTDEDGYFDGQEVANLYNPKGFAPVRLIDSGMVREYINANYDYRIYYPSRWEAAAIDEREDHVLFSGVTGDYIEVRAFDRLPAESFDAWFARSIEAQSFSDLIPFVNRFNVDGMKRRDDLVAYIPTDTTVFVIIYQPASDAADIPFRHVLQMMYQSFRPVASTVQLPQQVPIPGAAESPDTFFSGPSFDSGNAPSSESPSAEPLLEQ